MGIGAPPRKKKSKRVKQNEKNFNLHSKFHAWRMRFERMRRYGKQQ